MKPIKRSELSPGQRVRLYFRDGGNPWGWIEGRVIDNGPTGRIAQVRVSAEKLPYPDDASQLGHAEIIQANDLVFLMEDNE